MDCLGGKTANGMIKHPLPDSDAALRLLVAHGVCDAQAVERARIGGREAGIDSTEALVKLGLVPEA